MVIMTKEPSSRGRKQGYGNWDPMAGQAALCSGCCLLPVLVCGAVLVVLGHTAVPGACNTRLGFVLQSLGVLYLLAAALGCCSVTCMGSMLVEADAQGWAASADRYRDKEAQVDVQRRERRPAMSGPAIVLAVLGVLAVVSGILGLWAWGVAAAARAEPRLCGRSPTVFWIALAASLLYACVGSCLVAVRAAPS